MNWIPYVAAAAVVLIVLVLVWLTFGRRRRRLLLYTKRPSLLTAGEMRFYRALLPVVPPGLVVFVKVRLLDVVDVPGKAWLEYGAPASGMHLDFLLVEARTLTPLLVVELDDKSHSRPEVQKRDAFKDAALASAGVPILRVKPGRYDELRSQISRALA